MGGSSSTAGREAAAGLLARSLAGCSVTGPGYALPVLTPAFFAQVGRALIEHGQSLHVLDVTTQGTLRAFQATGWTITGNFNPDSWVIEADLAGPSRTDTRRIGYSGCLHFTWGTSPGSPHQGTSPLRGGSLTAKLSSEAERSLGDEASGPIGNLIPTPAGASGEDDPDGNPTENLLSGITADIAASRGRAILLETSSGGWGEGPSAKPQRDWMPNRIGPSPGAAFVQARKDAEASVLMACGAPSSLADPRAPGTSQREGLRRFFLSTLVPITRMIESELSRKLEAEITISHDLYSADLTGRASSFARLVGNGVSIEKALSITGLLAAAETESD